MKEDIKQQKELKKSLLKSIDDDDGQNSRGSRSMQFKGEEGSGRESIYLERISSGIEEEEDRETVGGARSKQLV